MTPARDIRGPVIRRLAEPSGERLYWRYVDSDDNSLWLGECVRDNGEWWCVRQIAPTPTGPAVYDWQRLEDEDGFLTDQPVPDDGPFEAIGANEFERAWADALRHRPRPRDTES